MEEMIDQLEKHHGYSEVRVTLRLVFRVVVPIIFLIGGLVLLSFRLPGWSLIIGLPMIIFGIVFLVYTYDEVVTDKVAEGGEGNWPCGKCRKHSDDKACDGPNDTVCLKCKERIFKNH
jgi:hypothetical protein